MIFTFYPHNYALNRYSDLCLDAINVVKNNRRRFVSLKTAKFKCHGGPNTPRSNQARNEIACFSDETLFVTPTIRTAFYRTDYSLLVGTRVVSM